MFSTHRNGAADFVAIRGKKADFSRSKRKKKISWMYSIEIGFRRGKLCQIGTLELFACLLTGFAYTGIERYTEVDPVPGMPGSGEKRGLPRTNAAQP